MNIVILISLLIIFYRIGEVDYRNGWPLAGISLCLSLLGNYFEGALGMLGFHFILFIGLIFYNMRRS